MPVLKYGYNGKDWIRAVMVELLLNAGADVNVKAIVIAFVVCCFIRNFSRLAFAAFMLLQRFLFSNIS